MRLRLLISLNCLLLLLGQRAGAQVAPADDFFHSGARFYISNSIPQAKEIVEQGLKLYPDDDKLKQLQKLLNQQQQQQQQNQQNQQQQNQQSKSDQQKQQDQQKSQDQQKQDQQKQDEQKKDQADQKKDDQQNKADQLKPQPEKDKDKDAADKEKQEEAQPVKAGEMTPEEAKHLMDAQKDSEQLLQLKPPEKPRNPSRPVKDW